MAKSGSTIGSRLSAGDDFGDHEAFNTDDMDKNASQIFLSKRVYRVHLWLIVLIAEICRATCNRGGTLGLEKNTGVTFLCADQTEPSLRA